MVLDRPFGGHLDDAVHEVTRVMYGAARYLHRPDVVGGTRFSDVYSASIDGRTVTVANARTYIDPGLLQAGRLNPTVAVCVAELPSVLPIVWIRPHRFAGLVTIAESKTGNPAFDELFQVIGMPATLAAVTGLNTPQDVLTPQLQQLIMGRDDWVFHAERNLFACITKGAFGSAAEISARVGEVLGIVAAIPASVLPAHVDHSVDDLMERVTRVDGVEGAIALLQGLTPAEREQLARSDTPLAAFADVQTPEQAIARFQSLDAQRRMQIMAMFMRAQDG
ncbi:MAG TPA: hypothetical protein VHY58_12435 [Streptosporangiaceae bacterium]|jgi:hypothetical protein|nr:hypothetical protein [Streptosporangiaceae bacterium]